ncbi:MAG: hypothetical protein H0X01_01050 [Nitrospira sp.]|nr:hypothetical protein [Nitrospira sp.]
MSQTFTMTVNQMAVEVFFKQPRSSAQWAYIARIADRAATLFEDGYGLLEFGGNDYNVLPPKHDGNPEFVYALNSIAPYCGCRCFEDNGDCKHRIACRARELEVEETAHFEALAAEHDRLMQDCEVESTGCDPHAEF